MGSSSVYSGTGEAKIVLQDTTFASAGGGINDLVYLQDGINTVFASGAWDAVIATQENQTIYGYTSDSGTVLAGSILVAVLQPNSDGTASGNDLVNGAGTDSVFVFDNSGGNTIDGGAGNLNFLGGSNVSDSIALGTGNAYVFGSAGDNLTFTSETTTGGNGILVAGDGSETLNGAAASNTLYITGDSTATSANDLFVGGTGTNYLTAGTGNETLQGGTGTNYFQINDSASGAANITLSDFSTNGSSTLFLDGGYTQADLQAIYNSTNDVDGNLVVTIGGSTSVTFTGITAGTQLQGHVVLFT
jgi:Ca2+-binding RTX toxin-like protein